jgi:hypothetical protein
MASITRGSTATEIAAIVSEALQAAAYRRC